MPEKSLPPPHFLARGGPALARAARPPLVRMLRLHELLSAGRFPNCSTVAAEFEVSAKTIQRDVDFMRDQLTLPIGYDAGRHGFAYTRPVAHFPTLTVSEGELVALLVAQKAVEQYRGTPFERPLRSAFDKLVSSLEEQALVSLHEVSEAVSFRSPGLPEAQVEVFGRLAAAVTERRPVEIVYRALRAGRPGRRRVDPYHLACISHQWYVIGKDHGRAGLRTFSLSRVLEVTLHDERFERPAGFSVSAMLAGSFSAFEAGRVERVRLRLDPHAARLASERKWHPSQTIEALPDGGAELRLEVGLAPDLEAWILGWGGHAEVVEPETLRDSIRRSGEEIVARYRRPSDLERPRRRSKAARAPAAKPSAPPASA